MNKILSFSNLTGMTLRIQLNLDGKKSLVRYKTQKCNLLKILWCKDKNDVVG